MLISTAKDLQARRRTRAGISPMTPVETDERESISSHSASTTAPSSPVSSDGDHRRAFSLNSLKSRALKSLSSNSDLKKRDITPNGTGIVDNTPGQGFKSHARKLSKSGSRPFSSASGRRGSNISEDHIQNANSRRLSFSVATDSLSFMTSSTSSSVDWRSQHVEGAGPLETDSTILKTKTPYLIVTTDYLVKVKNRSDALALFPCLATEAERQKPSNNNPEPIFAIPTSSIISAFPAESTRPSFGIEVWWKGLTGNSFYRSDFFFNLPKDRNEQLYGIIRAMRVAHQDDQPEMDADGSGSIRRCADVEGLLSRIQNIEEPKFANRKLEIFPVVPRGNTRKEFIPKAEDATKKPQESSAFYLVVGMYLCYFVEVQRGASKGGGGEPTRTYKTFGLVTLESFKGEWTRHEERFIISFREPFQQPVTLELASRHYRQIFRVFGQADRFLKPVWPQMWQAMELFWITGLKEVQYLVSREDYGSVKRTLDAYLAAYRCPPVDWEINWKTRFAPEFRLLPGRNGTQYTPLQILAVLRALRYNDYFNSLSFRDVDLSVLHGLEDNTLRKVNVAYLSRTCMTLSAEEVEMLRISPVLHQEFHALVFCAETIRQIDFTNCSRSLPERLRLKQGGAGPSLQFLTPILSALRSGITKCDRLLVGGNLLPQFDIDDVAETMKMGLIQALDIGYCGLNDMSLRDMIVTPLADRPVPLQSLSISGNPGRLPAYILPQLLYHLPEIRDLELRGSILGDSEADGPLLPLDTLDYLYCLEKLDISGFKLSENTIMELEQYLRHRSWKMDKEGGPTLRRLVLNNCGITGSQAAKLFDAIGENHGLHLCINGNPIEYGVEDLAAVIHQNKGPTGLYMEMIEFKHESNYLLLLNAMAETKYLDVLSLAGTAPSTSALGVCSSELVTALHDFFARNKSIRCLDLSGFSGKLDDSQLTKGFGRSLSGLAANKTMTHLRIRNQNLHDDAGTLGKVLSENNSVLLSLDVQENNLNLTSLRFLVDSMKTNTSIVDCPFSPAEQKDIWSNILSGLRRSRGGGSNQLKPEEAMLREILQQQFERLHEYLRRNRLMLEASCGQLLDLESPMAMPSSSSADGISSGGSTDKEEMWPLLALDLDLNGRSSLDLGDHFATIGTGTNYTRKNDGADGDGGCPPYHAQPQTTYPQRRPTVRSSAIEKVDAPLPMPYHNLMLNGGVIIAHGVESPAETLDPVSEVETPPADVFSPGEEPDPIFQKMMNDFRAAGFAD